MSASSKNWFRPGDAGYEDLRQIYNGAHQAHPAIIARVRTVDEVRTALSHAWSEGLSIAVRGGGHSIAGFGSVVGGLVIDLRDLNTIEPAEMTGQFWIGGGCVAGEVASTLEQRGLVVPLGDSPSVGIGGITLGGGIGWLTRKFGLTLDSLTAAEIVTADGAVSIADEAQQPELFWALRGGGGNFGVVTRLRFQPHRLGPVLGGSMVLPLSVESLAGILTVAAAAPEDLGVIALAMRSPPGDTRATPMLSLTLVWSGDALEGARVLAQLRTVATPITEEIGVRSYADMFRLAAGAPASITNATESFFADAINADAIGVICEAATDRVAHGLLSAIEIRILGGAMARVPASATAFAHRNRKLLISAVRAGYPMDRYAEHRAWVTSVRQRLSHLETGRYLNFIEQPSPTDVSGVYPGRTAARLAAVKQAVDPANVFARHLPLKPEGPE
jgi:hypothetical protein